MYNIILKYLDREFNVSNYNSQSFFSAIKGCSIKHINSNQFVSLMNVVRDINHIFCVNYASNDPLFTIWIQDSI